MNKYRKLIPLVAVVLIAFGVNLEKFGINLHDFTGQSSNSSSQSAPANNSQASQQSAEDGNATLSAGNLPHWSQSDPKVNLKHIFEGEINRRGRPVGYHSRPGGIDPATSRVNQVKSKPNSVGVYTASISVRDGDQWKEKFSSFFPDNMSHDEVIAAILQAYKNSEKQDNNRWTGPSGLGFSIQGFTLSGGDINTAFPLYVNSQ